MTPRMKNLSACLGAALLVASGYQWAVPQKENTATAMMTAPTTPPPRLARAELEHGPRHLRQIALTFDAGGETDGLPDLLRVLEREETTATFFLTGRWACENLALARAIASQGHAIGNHTWSHKDLTELEDAGIRGELLRTDDRFVGWFGARYQPLVRAPYGETNERVRQVIENLGFHGIRWSIDTLDAMEPRKTASFIESRILGTSDAELQGAIVLMHVGYPETVAALPVVIHHLRERGFEFVPVSVWVPELGLPNSKDPIYNWPLAQP